MQNIVSINDKKVETMTKVSLGEDLGYQPFSSWYGRVLEELESSVHITEPLFFRALEHFGAVSRKGSQIVPPENIYNVMKGRSGVPTVGEYCKKFSSIKGEFVESYGICLDKLELFEAKYMQTMLSFLSKLEDEIQEEAEEAEEYAEARKAKAERGTHGRISKKANKMFLAGKEDVIQEAFKGVKHG